MTPLSRDTEPWAEALQAELIRNATPAQRLKLALQLTCFSWNATRAAIDRLNPEKTQDERDRLFLTQLYGSETAEWFFVNRDRQRREAEARERT